MRSVFSSGAVCAASLGKVASESIAAGRRLNDEGAWILEVAARSIGGLCARTLRVGAGVSLEELILRHAAGLELPPHHRERSASGVLMLPIRHAGRLREVRGQSAARAVPHIDGLSITVPRGETLVPLPEGDRYLGFLFARATTPGAVETALRAAGSRLAVLIDEADAQGRRHPQTRQPDRRTEAGTLHRLPHWDWGNFQ
jgi:hypothetical protein